MERGTSDFDGEAYISDLIDALVEDTLDAEHKGYSFQEALDTQTHHSCHAKNSGIAVTGGTITAELEAPGVTVTVEADRDHPAVESIDRGDYVGDDGDCGEPSISERLEQQR